MKHSMYIPTTETVVEIERKKSRFIGVLLPVEDRSQVESCLAALHTPYPNPTHIVYAFRFGGLDREIEGLSDDGEPKGTAGRPVRDVLTGHQVTNALLAVVRYFGGTKLGTGGLVRAYGDCARAVLEEAELHELIPRVELCFSVSYAIIDQIQRIITDVHAEVLAQDFGTEVALSIRVPAVKVEEVVKSITDVSAGGVVIDRSDRISR
ncbi:MAG: YigZ family protein [Spirochaeta sp.]